MISRPISIGNRSGLDGVNLLPHLTGEKNDPPHDFLAWRWIAQSAISEGNWKLLCGGKREYLYDLATRLRTKLQAWSGDLVPPGLTNGDMAPTWNEYFDHYLEGKTAALSAKASVEKDLLQGWFVRNGTAAIQKGALVITPDQNAPKRTRPFIAHANIDLSGPVTATVSLRTKRHGDLAFAWRAKVENDFLPANKAILSISAKDDPQTLHLPLLITGHLIHLRLQPAIPVSLEILLIHLRSRDGKEQIWDFSN